MNVLKDAIKRMLVGDIVELVFEGYQQMTITCTHNCGFKNYIVMGNAISDKIFFEGNSKEEHDECIDSTFDYVINSAKNFGKFDAFNFYNR